MQIKLDKIKNTLLFVILFLLSFFVGLRFFNHEYNDLRLERTFDNLIHFGENKILVENNSIFLWFSILEEIGKDLGLPAVDLAVLYSRTINLYVEVLETTNSREEANISVFRFLKKNFPHSSIVLEKVLAYKRISPGASLNIKSLEILNKHINDFESEKEKVYYANNTYSDITFSKPISPGAKFYEKKLQRKTFSLESVKTPEYFNNNIALEEERRKLQEILVEKDSTREVVNFWSPEVGGQSLAFIWQKELLVNSLLSENDILFFQQELANIIADNYVFTWEMKYHFLNSGFKSDLRKNTRLESPQFPSEHDIICNISNIFFKKLFPDKQVYFEQLKNDCIKAPLYAGINFEGDMVVGETLIE